jgi:hypothetical protein
VQTTAIFGVKSEGALGFIYYAPDRHLAETDPRIAVDKMPARRNEGVFSLHRKVVMTPVVSRREGRSVR